MVSTEQARPAYAMLVDGPPWFLRHLAFGWALTAATATMLGVARWLGVQL